MCGLAGFVRLKGTTGPQDNSVSDMMTQALLTGTLRGKDSFGVLTNESKDREVKDIFKLPLAAPDVWQSPIVTSTLAQQFRYASMGVIHHRAATVGGVTQRAAHPYRVVGKERTIWGVHNGSLNNYNLHQGTGKTAFATDSEWMFAQLADKGPAELKHIRGAFACVWLQSDDTDHVYFARNSERPLYYAFSDDRKIFIYGSEWKMMDWLATRNNISLNKDAEGFVWREFPKDRVFTVNLDTLAVTDIMSVAPPVVQATPNKSWPHNQKGYVTGFEDYEADSVGVGWHTSRRYPGITTAEIGDADSMGVLGEVLRLKFKKVKTEADGYLRVTFDEVTDKGAKGFRCVCRDFPADLATLLDADGAMFVCEVGGAFFPGGKQDDIQLIVNPPLWVDVEPLPEVAVNKPVLRLAN